MWYLGSWMSSMSSGITYLVMEKSFPDTNMRPLILHSINLRSSFPKLINYKPTHNQPYCVSDLRTQIKLFNHRSTHNPTHRYFCAGDIINTSYDTPTILTRVWCHPINNMSIIEGTKIYIWPQHDSCGTQGGVYILRSIYTYDRVCFYI